MVTEKSETPALDDYVLRCSSEEIDWWIAFAKTLWTRIELYQNLPAILTIVKTVGIIRDLLFQARKTDGGQLQQSPLVEGAKEESDSSGDDEDEWGEMEPVDMDEESQSEKKPTIQVLFYYSTIQFQVTLKPKKNTKVEDMDLMIAKYLRTFVNKGIREYAECHHKVPA